MKTNYLKKSISLCSALQQEKFKLEVRLREINRAMPESQSAAPAGACYYHADALGSVTHLTSGTGAVVERCSYDVFGLPAIKDGGGATLTASACTNRFLFQGREWLAEVQLNDHRHRYCSPGLGRWLNRDPLGEKGGVNFYSFVSNMPLNGIDAYGHKRLVITKWKCVLTGPPIIPNPSVPPPGNTCFQDCVYSCTDKTGAAATWTFARPRGWPCLSRDIIIEIDWI